MSEFKDHFSSHAAQYRDARPSYPDEWFVALAKLVPSRASAWDAGCGNGQASIALAAHFEHVYASDPSAQQIANAVAHDRVTYAVSTAEQCALADASVDMVIVAQALHWFDVPRFHAQVRRVLRSGGVIAEWGYGECAVAPAVDAVCRHLYADILGAFWPPERMHVENAYADLGFPFPRLRMPEMNLTMRWNLAQYLGYLTSWSALQRYRALNHSDPMLLVADRFSAAWGDPAAVKTVFWPLFSRVGRG